MKKFLSILASLAIIPSAAATTIACSSSKKGDVLVAPCEITNVKASKVDSQGYSTVTFDVTQYVNTSYTAEDIQKYSVVNDGNGYDQETADPDNKTPENKIPVAVSDIVVKIDDKVLTVKPGSVLTTMHVSFKAKIENISEHHAFEWVQKTNGSEYNVIEVFVVKLPGVRK